MENVLCHVPIFLFDNNFIDWILYSAELNRFESKGDKMDTMLLLCVGVCMNTEWNIGLWGFLFYAILTAECYENEDNLPRRTNIFSCDNG